MSEQAENSALANINDADRVINEQLQANDGLHVSADMKPITISSESDLVGGGQIRKDETMMADKWSITNSPSGSPAETSAPSTVKVTKHQNMGQVVAETRHTSDTGNSVQYGSYSDAKAYGSRNQDGTARVTRTYTDELGETKQYTHAFKTPGAARLVTKLALKRIERDNPIPYNGEAVDQKVA